MPPDDARDPGSSTAGRRAVRKIESKTMHSQVFAKVVLQLALFKQEVCHESRASNNKTVQDWQTSREEQGIHSGRDKTGGKRGRGQL